MDPDSPHLVAFIPGRGSDRGVTDAGLRRDPDSGADDTPVRLACGQGVVGTRVEIEPATKSPSRRVPGALPGRDDGGRVEQGDGYGCEFVVGDGVEVGNSRFLVGMES